MTVTVGSTDTAEALYMPPQTKMFKDEQYGYLWLFFSDGNSLVYYVSMDEGETWNGPYTARSTCTSGEEFSLAYNPAYSKTYIYYAFAEGAFGTNVPLYFRRGTLQSDGTISWESEITVYAGSSSVVVGYPSIAVGTDGRIHIGTNLGSTTGFYWREYSNPNNDGSGSWTLTRLSGKVSDSTTYPWRGSFLALTAGKVYTTYHSSRWAELWGRLWDGSSWLSEETIYSGFAGAEETHDAVANDDEVAVAWPYPTVNDISFAIRDPAAGWQPREQVTNDGYYPTLSVDKDGNYWVFSTDGTKKQIFYWKREAGVWSDKTELISPEVKNIFPYSVHSLEKFWDEKVGVAWTMGEIRPYSIRFHRYEAVIVVPAKKLFGDGLVWIVQ